MGLSVLRSVLKRMKECSGPAWLSIIADEATDINQAEQLNLSIHWVDDEYQAHEDPVGLFRVPDTKAETLFKVIKDLLIRCDLPLALCRGKHMTVLPTCKAEEQVWQQEFVVSNQLLFPCIAVHIH